MVSLQRQGMDDVLRNDWECEWCCTPLSRQQTQEGIDAEQSDDGADIFVDFCPSTKSPPSVSFQSSRISHSSTTHIPICFSTASCSQQGPRAHQEDAFAIIENIGSCTTKTMYCAVFDGHGGSVASNYAASAAHNHIAVAPSFATSLPQAVVDGLRHTDMSLYELDPHLRGGATALVACARDRIVHVANIGDSQAYACVCGKTLPLSSVHKPSIESERDRIVRKGGTVDFGRLSGELDVSRGLGDFIYKIPSAEESIVSNVADVSSIEITDSVEFLLLATDGLWDVVTGEEAIEFVCDALRRSASCEDEEGQLLTPRNPFQKIIEDLVALAYMRHTSDNVTVIGIKFHP